MAAPPGGPQFVPPSPSSPSSAAAAAAPNNNVTYKYPASLAAAQAAPQGGTYKDPRATSIVQPQSQSHPLLPHPLSGQQVLPHAVPYQQSIVVPPPPPSAPVAAHPSFNPYAVHGMHSQIEGSFNGARPAAPIDRDVLATAARLPVVLPPAMPVMATHNNFASMAVPPPPPPPPVYDPNDEQPDAASAGVPSRVPQPYHQTFTIPTPTRAQPQTAQPAYQPPPPAQPSAYQYNALNDNDYLPAGGGTSVRNNQTRSQRGQRPYGNGNGNGNGSLQQPLNSGGGSAPDVDPPPPPTYCGHPAPKAPPHWRRPQWVQWATGIVINLGIMAFVTIFWFTKVIANKKGFQAACFNTSDMDDYVCFFAAGQKAHGIIAVGQMAVGAVTFGQLAIGLLFGVGQLIGSLGWVPVCQIGNAAYINKAQVGFTFLRVCCAQFGISLMYPFVGGAVVTKCGCGQQ